MISALASPGAPLTTAQCEAQFSVACYQPAQMQRAYDLTRLFRRGVDGAGQTIAIVDAFGSPTIAADLATFDRAFHLPKARLKVIEPVGPVPPFDPNDATMAGWAGETTLDVEWAHVMAPGARILLVLTPVAETVGAVGFSEIVAAENYVINHHLASVISQSFQTTEQTFPGLPALQPLRSAFINASHHGVTVLASSGDQGASGVVERRGHPFLVPGDGLAAERSAGNRGGRHQRATRLDRQPHRPRHRVERHQQRRRQRAQFAARRCRSPWPAAEASPCSFPARPTRAPWPAWSALHAACPMYP